MASLAFVGRGNRNAMGPTDVATLQDAASTPQRAARGGQGPRRRPAIPGASDVSPTRRPPARPAQGAAPLDPQRPWLGAHTLEGAIEEVLRAHLCTQGDGDSLLRAVLESADRDGGGAGETSGEFALATALYEEGPRACYAAGPEAFRAVVLRAAPQAEPALDAALNELRAAVRGTLVQGPKASVAQVGFALREVTRLAKEYCKNGARSLLAVRGTPPAGKDFVLAITYGCPAAKIRLPAAATFRRLGQLVSELAYDPDPTHGVMFLIPADGQHGTHPPGFNFAGVAIDDPRSTEPHNAVSQPDSTPIGAYFRSGAHASGVGQLWMLWDFGSTQSFRIRVADELPHAGRVDPWVERPELRTLDDDNAD